MGYCLPRYRRWRSPGLPNFQPFAFYAAVQAARGEELDFGSDFDTWEGDFAPSSATIEKHHYAVICHVLIHSLSTSLVKWLVGRAALIPIASWGCHCSSKLLIHYTAGVFLLGHPKTNIR